MNEAIHLHGRCIEPQQLAELIQLVRDHPHWSRYRLSRELCALWNWRTADGRLRDMAARTVLLKLEQRGWLELPARRMASPNAHRLAPAARLESLPARIQAGLADLKPIQIREVSADRQERRELRAVLAQFHYLGYRAAAGRNLQYTVRDRAGRLLAVLVFASAAWKCAARDRWIGWDQAGRQAHLNRIANNCRYLILPGVRVKYLASWILGAVARRLAGDWQAKYEEPVVLLETFVEVERFAGTCYRAANWVRVGRTTGRSRQDRHHTLRVPIKEVYLYPLVHPVRKALGR